MLSPSLSRPLTPREREILEFLLSPQIPGIEELRRQADRSIARAWDCGCASIDLIVDRREAPRSSIATGPAVEAYPKDRHDPLRIFDLMLCANPVRNDG